MNSQTIGSLAAGNRSRPGGLPNRGRGDARLRAFASVWFWCYGVESANLCELCGSLCELCVFRDSSVTLVRDHLGEEIDHPVALAAVLDELPEALLGVAHVPQAMVDEAHEVVRLAIVAVEVVRLLVERLHGDGLLEL